MSYHAVGEIRAVATPADIKAGMVYTPVAPVVTPSDLFLFDAQNVKVSATPLVAPGPVNSGMNAISGMLPLLVGGAVVLYLMFGRK
jgi:hypothetical protein